MTTGRAVRARLERMKRDLLGFVTLRRRESAFGPYLMRLFALTMLLVVVPLKVIWQLGVVGTLLAAVKVALVAAVVVGALAVAFGIGEIARQRRRRSALKARGTAAVEAS